MDLQILCDLLIEKVERDYAGDVSLIHIYGSYTYGDTHSRSDLDVYFVPKTERGYQLACTFILQGIGMDFWPLSWERLERIANYEEKTASMITDGRTIYYHSEEDQIRFEDLVAKVKNKDTNRSVLDATANLREAYEIWFHMKHADSIAKVRAHAIDVLYVLSSVLGEINGMPIKRGRKFLKNEILAMPRVPENFAELYDTAFFSEDIADIQQAYGQLIANTEKILIEAKDESGEGFQQAFRGWYEELIQFYNKIYHACETEDPYTALFAAVEYTHELQEQLKRVGIEPTLPDMVAAYDPKNLTVLEDVARQHQEAMEALLNEHGVEIRRFDSFEEVREMLDAL